MPLPTVRVMSDPKQIGMGVRVFVDGFEIPGLLNVITKTPVGEAPIVTLEIRCKLETADYEPKEPINANTKS